MDKPCYCFKVTKTSKVNLYISLPRIFGVFQDSGSYIPRTLVLQKMLIVVIAVLSHSVRSDSVTPWTAARQAPLSKGFSRQEHWSGEPFPSPGDLPNPGIEPRSPTLQADSLPFEPPGKPKNTGVGSLSLLQGIFPTWEANQGLLCCRRILYQLSYQESPHHHPSQHLLTTPGPLHLDLCSVLCIYYLINLFFQGVTFQEMDSPSIFILHMKRSKWTKAK